MTESVLAWHFLPEDRRLRYGDRQLVEVGKPIRVKGRLEMCRHGLHASIKVMDALRYAPGPIACRVVVRGHIKHDDDKLVGQQRTVAWMLDATDILREFARWCALEVIHLWDAPQVVRDYLATGNEDIRDAAWAAAKDTAWAAGDAARTAARAAAWAAGAAGDAAWAAAKDTAWAAGDAARTAARAAQNDKLTELLLGAQA